MDGSDREQETIRCVLMRGGTSKGLYFRGQDVPGPGAERDELLRRLMGSPDVLQIDGLGGSRPITSKVAIVSRSGRADADVDYTFAQVEIEGDRVVYAGNCGNISSGVGPFAVDEGMVPAVEPTTRVRIYNTNTERIIVADVPVRGGRARVLGDFAVPGVPGTGAEIAMNWADTVGASTGRLLPTGRPSDAIRLESGEAIEASLVDAANPCVWVRASDFGIDGSELVDAIDGNAGLIDRVREARGKAAALFGLCRDWRKVDEESPGLPLLGLVAAPKGYQTLGGAEVGEADMDLRVRLMFMNRLHESIAGTASICLAAASRVEGSVVRSVARAPADDVLRIGHPSGITPARVEGRPTDGPPGVAFELLGFSRTSRRLMDCSAYYPANLLDPIARPVGRDASDRGPGVVHE